MSFLRTALIVAGLVAGASSANAFSITQVDPISYALNTDAVSFTASSTVLGSDLAGFYLDNVFSAPHSFPGLENGGILNFSINGGPLATTLDPSGLIQAFNSSVVGLTDPLDLLVIVRFPSTFVLNAGDTIHFEAGSLGFSIPSSPSNVVQDLVAGTYDAFLINTDGQQVSTASSATIAEIAAVPLPASLWLLIGASGLILGVRRGKNTG
ncbi:hypothetical protein [Pacificoceanicola onchidii]|uniref:hypothetical protein n=1 Tax=Pacificoceanicola onchidii TaxID=2562685 RepID=UPI0010A61A29|nr:hypothetical protein [Pacificoceanicola onchidii]